MRRVAKCRRSWGQALKATSTTCRGQKRTHSPLTFLPCPQAGGSLQSTMGSMPASAQLRFGEEVSASWYLAAAEATLAERARTPRRVAKNSPLVGIAALAETPRIPSYAGLATRASPGGPAQISNPAPVHWATPPPASAPPWHTISGHWSSAQPLQRSERVRSGPGTGHGMHHLL